MLVLMNYDLKLFVIKGGESNLASVAKMVLNDFQRGKLPYYVLPPGCDKEKLELEENKEFIDNMMAEQEKIERDNPTAEEGAEAKSETEVSGELAQKIAKKIADKKNKTKAVEKKAPAKARELSGLKKKLKNWDKAQ